jgi:hypothetical protein
MAPRLVLLLLAVLAASACSAYTVPRYGLSAENVTGLKKLGSKVNLGAFTATTPGQTEIRCRAVGPVRTPDSRPFEDYIRRALLDELRIADVYSEGAPVTLTVSSKYEFSPGPMFQPGPAQAAAARACAETAQAFAPAVQVLIGKLVYHPELAQLLK